MELREFGTMVDTIEKAFNPFHLVICILGCGIFRHSLGHSRFCLSIFYILTVWSVYACVFYYMVIFFTPNRIFAGFLMFFTIMINLFVTIISIIMTIRDHEKFLMSIRNLSFVDDTLKQLGIPKEYCKMRQSIKYILIVWFMMICITWAVDSRWSVKRFHDKRAIIIPAIVHYPFHLNTFMDIIFIFLLRYIGTRLNKINDYIGQLSETKEYRLRRTWKKPLVIRCNIRRTEHREHVLWTAMHLHLKLCRIARNINDVYGIQITFQMMSYFVFLTGVFYLQYNITLCLKQFYRDSVPMEYKLTILMHGYVWCGIYLTKLVTLNYICESVGDKAKKTKHMIYKLTNSVYFNQIREDIFQFVLQISLQPLKFNGMGLFCFGYNFIRKFIVGVVSIVIFMMQMDSFPLSRILISRKNNKFLMCIKNLSSVDDTLEQLGLSKEYSKLQNLIKCLSILWFIMICIINAIDGRWAIERFQDIKAIIIPTVLHYPYHLNTFLDIIFIVLLRCIDMRLTKINDYIGQLSETEEYRLGYTKKKPLTSCYCIRSTENREHILWTAMHLHLELCRIARNINSIYGIRITLQMVFYFVIISAVCYAQYDTLLCFEQIYRNDVPLTELALVIHRYIWCGIFITRLVILNYICESVVAKAEKTKDIIYKLTNLVCFNQIREDPLKFSGMGLFYFGYNFIRQFTVGIVSIVIFMVQMDPSPLSRILILRKDNETCYV
ncbi:uncharacterized protein [Anoplolepis gracilipes]|uniref:uncharacterized protein n=1 Tax=Anoplolepis gracilipes TaxID=354296 RepID=UPI003BA05F92